MTRKVVSNSDPGDADTFGGDDIDNLMDDLARGPWSHSYLIIKSGSNYVAISPAGEAFSTNASFATVLSAVQTAVTTAPGGGIIKLAPKTTFPISSTYNMGTRTTLEGSGDSTILDFTGITSTNASIVMAEQCVLRNFKILGSVASLPAGLTGRVRTGNHCKVENLYITDMGQGIVVQGSTDVQIRNVRLENIKDVDDQADGIHINSTSNGITVDGFYMKNCNRGVETEDQATNVWVQNGYMESIKNFNATGHEAFSIDAHCHDGDGAPNNVHYRNIYLKDTETPNARHAGSSFADADMPKHISFENITVDNPHSLGSIAGWNISFKNVRVLNDVLTTGVLFSVGRNSRQISIKECSIDDIQSNHVFFNISHADAKGIKLEDCKIIANTNHSSGNKTILLQNGDSIICAGNQCLDTKGANAIYADTTPTNTVIRGNYITYAASSPADYGIWSEAPGAIISENRFGTGPGFGHMTIRNGAIRTDVSRNFIPDAYIQVRNNASYTNIHDNIFAPSIIGISIEATRDHLFISNNINYTEYSDKALVYTDSPYAILDTDDMLRVDASGGSSTVIVTLPTAVGIPGKTYTVKRTDIIASTNLLSVATTSSQTIDGAASYYLWPAEWVKVESNGTNWVVTSRNTPCYFFNKGSTANRRYVACGSFPFQPIALNSTTSPAINTLWALPLPVPITTKFDTITFRITTTAVGNARAGIYRDNGNCYPGALIFDTGAIDVSTGNAKDTTITAGLQTFAPGLYWLAWECDVGTLQIRVINGVTNICGILGQLADMSSANPAYGYSVAHTFGTLPDPYTASATILNTTPAAGVPIPYLSLRAI